MTMLPAGTCDAHLHVYDGRYPVDPRAVVHAPDALPDDYLAVARSMGIDRAVVVQPTAYGLDNRCQLAAIEALVAAGLDVRGVMVVDANSPATELDRLHTRGVRGARFHLLPGGAVAVDDLEPVALAIAPLGWHVQLQLDGNVLPGLVDRLAALPCPLVIDHVGRFMPPPPPDDAAVGALLALLETGDCWVKLSAPYESSADRAPEYPEVTALVDHLVDRTPDRLVWATNWPHPGQADPPTTARLLDLVERWLPDPDVRRAVLVDNPALLYGF